MRTLDQLVNRDEPGIVLVRQWVEEATNPVSILPCEPAAGERTLVALQVTTRSPMGAIAYETGGVLVDGGWLRILGAGGNRIGRNMADWNGMPAGPHRLSNAMLVGDDAVGGFFAVNGGAFEGPPGHVFYLAPDTLAWEDCELGYSDWLVWAFSGDLEQFYENARWPGWEAEVQSLAGDRAYSIYPFLFTDGPPVGERSRKDVPIAELWKLFAEELPRQLSQQA